MTEEGKRVSWVELYLDLVFVLGVGQIAHLIVSEPEMHSVWIALGLFFTLWWTWVGFAVLYNRHGADEPRQRLLYLAASVPAGVAAVAIEPASHGDSTVFALSLAITRLVLATANEHSGEGNALLRAPGHARVPGVGGAVPDLDRRPGAVPLRAVGDRHRHGVRRDAGEDREAARRLRRDHDLTKLKPADPDEAVDAHHFAERFGLFVIILLGEVVVEAGQASIDTTTAGGWAALVAAMVLAGALWWLYFDSAAEINLQGARALGRVADDGAGDLRRRAHAAGVRAADHGVRRGAAAGGGPAADRRAARLRRRRDLPARHARDGPRVRAASRARSAS